MQLIAGLHKTFPDWHFRVEDMLAEGDKVAYGSTTQGTDKGGFRGLPATDKQIDYDAVGILRFANGKVVERWTIADSTTLTHQLRFIRDTMKHYRAVGFPLNPNRYAVF